MERKGDDTVAAAVFGQPDGSGGWDDHFPVLERYRTKTRISGNDRSFTVGFESGAIAL